MYKICICNLLNISKTADHLIISVLSGRTSSLIPTSPNEFPLHMKRMNAHWSLNWWEAFAANFFYCTALNSRTLNSHLVNWGRTSPPTSPPKTFTPSEAYLDMLWHCMKTNYEHVIWAGSCKLKTQDSTFVSFRTRCWFCLQKMFVPNMPKYTAQYLHHIFFRD